MGEKNATDCDLFVLSPDTPAAGVCESRLWRGDNPKVFGLIHIRRRTGEERIAKPRQNLNLENLLDAALKMERRHRLPRRQIDDGDAAAQIASPRRDRQ